MAEQKETSLPSENRMVRYVLCHPDHHVDAEGPNPRHRPLLVTGVVEEVRSKKTPGKVLKTGTVSGWVFPDGRFDGGTDKPHFVDGVKHDPTCTEFGTWHTLEEEAAALAPSDEEEEAE